MGLGGSGMVFRIKCWFVVIAGTLYRTKWFPIQQHPHVLAAMVPGWREHRSIFCAREDAGCDALPRCGRFAPHPAALQCMGFESNCLTSIVSLFF